MKSIYSLLVAALFAPVLMYAQPVNDNCTGALPIEIDGAAVVADNEGATYYGPEGSCLYGDVLDGNVWFTITVTEPSILLISTEAGTSFDSQLTLFTIENCGESNETFQEIACNEDMGFFEGMSQIITEELQPGTYYLAASTYSNGTTTNAGTYSISVSTATTATNDSCEGAIELILDGPAELADNTFATMVGPEGSCYATTQLAGDVWYMFTATEGQNIRITTAEGTSIDTEVSVWTIENCGSGNEVYTEVACNEDASGSNYMAQVDMYDIAAGTYYIKAGTYSDFFTGTFSISLQSIPDAPANSDCSGVEPFNLTVGDPAMVVTGSATGAIDMEGLGQPHVWEAFTIEECADVLIDYCNITPEVENAYITLFQDCPVNFDNTISAFDFNFTSCSNLSITFIQLPAGTYYYPVMSSEEYTVLDSYSLNFTASVCTAEPDTCLTYAAGPWGDFNSTFDGAPVPNAEGVCEVYQFTNFEVYASESYTIDGFAANVNYTFSICDGGNAGAWSPALSVTDPNGTLVAYEENCSISWTTQMEGTYVIGISEAGACYNSENTAVSNGYPTLSCEGTVGITEVGNTGNFSVYPNPNNGNFSILNSGISGNYTIELIDITGRIVYANSANLNANSETNVSVNGLAPGVYMLKMMNAKENSSTTQKIVVR